MGKQASPKSPRPENSVFNVSYGTRDNHQSRCSEMQPNGESYKGRRGSGGVSKWFRNDSGKFSYSKGVHGGKKHIGWLRRHIRLILLTFSFMGSLLLLDSVFFSLLDAIIFKNYSSPRGSMVQEDIVTVYRYEESKPIKMYDRLLHLASSSLAEEEFEEGASKFWKELYPQASLWQPCANKKNPKGKSSNRSGFIIVSANGGLNQQRVAVCNAVAVASLLNATLVIPKFLYSNVWKDPSQFGDIYQQDYFIEILKNDIEIVKEIPEHLQSLDFDAIGSQVTDADLSKEATPQEYISKVLPILLRNGVVHFLGFGNRLGFDPLPIELQRLRCKCNFHALKYGPKIQQAGSLLIRRLRKYDATRTMLDKQLLGSFIQETSAKESHHLDSPLKYVALHLRFEIDMVAYSMCDFGGGENERRELQEYREAHFPLLVQRIKNSDPSPGELRELGRCPLTPEEAALILAALGFKNNTYIYLASSKIYGGESRMDPFISLYPNVVTKEDLLLPNELAPFRNFSSQLAALDFIACATADVFAITDSGSQLSSLVSGFRTYYGGGNAPTLSPLKKRLAAILSQNNTIKWNAFEKKVQKMIEEIQRVRQRGLHRSLYRHPRCKGCMCKYH